MLVYIHVPFCRSKCAYCAFYSTPLGSQPPEVLERYVDGLCAEIAHWGKGLGRPRVQTVYLGGGTPTLLPPWGLKRITGALRKHFRLEPGLEFSSEANPESADAETLRVLRELGVNRLSMGVQSLDPEALCFLGRGHTPDQALDALARARTAGFANLGVDLIWGLPGQRLATWQRHLATLVKEIRPEHISAYGLSIEPDTPLARRAAQGELEQWPPMPDEDESAAIFVRGSEYLQARGYLHYEISNFARMGYACRHNQGYWEGADYLGLGPAAVSTIAGVRRENPSEIAAWLEQVRNPGSPGLARLERLDPRTRLDELVMLSLRTSRGLDLARYREQAGAPFGAGRSELLKVLRAHDLIRLTRETLRLTPRGWLVSDTIIARLLEDPTDVPADPSTPDTSNPTERPCDTASGD